MMGKRLALNRSRQAMMMNDMAFPGSAINTVGFRLDFTEDIEDKLEEAVRTVIERAVLLHMEYEEENGEAYLRDTGKPVCGLVKSVLENRAEADRLWEKKTEQYLKPGSWLAEVYGFKEGGCCLFFLIHHVILDGYTAMQLAQLFLSELDGREWPADIDPYYDGSDESEASETDGEEDKKFWIRYFDGTDAEDSVMSGEAAGCDRRRRIYRLPDELTEKINRYEKDKGIKDSALFGAALSLWLARATQKRDAVFLMPRLNRENRNELSAMSCRTLVVPVRVSIEEKDSFTDICLKCTDQARLASKHKAYGMRNIMNDLHKTGIMTGRMSEYVLNCIHGGVLKSAHAFDLKESMSGGMNNHVTMAVQRMPDCINIIYDYRVGIYDDDKLKYFHEAMIRITEQAVCGSMLCRDMEICGEAEAKKLSAMEGPHTAIDENASIPDIFRKAAEKYADRPAYHAGKYSYSFSELDRVSNRIANALIDKGIERGEPVLYKLKRDHRLLPVVLGILKSGAAFIPVDPAYPQVRIEYIQNDSGAKYIVVCKETLEEDGFEHLDADELMQYADDSDPKLLISPDSLAYSIYTSGTTGNPKGVLLSHRGIVNITHPENNPFNREVVKNGTGLVAIGSVCFDISLFEFFVPLFNGCFIEMAPEKAMADPKALAELIFKHGANLIHCTPSRLSAYLKDEDFSRAMMQTDAILSAGEVLPRRLVEELKENFDVLIFNGYGPTEVTIGASITEEGDDTSIGRPIGNTGIMLLDKQGRLVPFGAAGEICIYGKGLGIGYHKLPEETEEKFRMLHGRRLYFTGDLGRFMPDGRLEYMGRNDLQVKIRGLRIELSGIENRMLAFEGVADASVHVRNINGRDSLIGFYTCRAGMNADEDELKKYLKEHLTAYMVPDVIKRIDEIPLTPGGKTDMRALREIPVELNFEYRAPENEYQRIICEEYGRLLGISRVGIGDNFFEIGGDSLHVAEIISRINERIEECELKFSDLFRYPEPEGLAQYLYRKKASAVIEEDDDRLKKPDYEKIDEMLAGNTVAELIPGKKRRLGNVLLTGATGFLGLHMLTEILRNPDDYDKIYCLVRPTERLDPEKRLKNLLNFFENGKEAELLGKRVFAVAGDIAQEKIFDVVPEAAFDTVINCAANVAHFAYGDKLERANITGVRNLLKLCEKHKALFVQISTISVGGLYERGKKVLTIKEKNLFIDQKIHNQYILSKYLAEYEALKAMAEGRCDVKIMRIGNLQGRLSDGEFQLNIKTNAFTRRLASYVKIGLVPEEVYFSEVDFSPVDEVAAMIEKLAMTDRKHTVFHVMPPGEIPMRKLFDEIEKTGYNIYVVPEDIFEENIELLRDDEEYRELIEGIILESPDLKYERTREDQSFTNAMTQALGLKWGSITREYIHKSLKVLHEFGVFER
ncbi:MAG: amino acid adenylation domain-containing protein [Lachnospiraceae bacterium]|nr:amino acid adenylation domain-containing protein [Lachnospiraceae bacterium]